MPGKLDLVRVSGEFELSGFYCVAILPWAEIECRATSALLPTHLTRWKGG